MPRRVMYGWVMVLAALAAIRTIAASGAQSTPHLEEITAAQIADPEAPDLSPAHSQRRTPGRLEAVMAGAGPETGVVFTDARHGLEPLPLNDLEVAKLAMARAAVEAADRAGTRSVRPPRRPRSRIDGHVEADKLERRRTMTPRETRNRPGVPDEAWEVAR